MSNTTLFSRLLAAFVIMVLLGACDSDSGSADDRPEGLYQLKTINGSPLPYSFVNEQGTTTIEAATIDLRETGLLHHVLEYSFQSVGFEHTTPVTQEESGTWQIADNELLVSWAEHGTTFFEPLVSDGAIDLKIKWYPDIDLQMHFEK